jgi:hypothetical protein
MNEELLIRKLEHMISNHDIRKILGNERIVTYADLDNYTNILDLLPMEKDYVILLIEWNPSSGHWVAITRNNKTLSYMDSYGLQPDAQIKKNSAETRDELEQEPNKLIKLMSTAPKDFKLVYSKKRLQTIDPDYQCNTCGSWCLLFIIMNLCHNMSLMNFQKWILKQEQDSGIPRDIIVANKIIPDNLFQDD